MNEISVMNYKVMIGNSECEWDSLTEKLGQDGLAVLFFQESLFSLIINLAIILKIRFIF